MKRKLERNILSWLLVLCMIISMFSSGIIAKAEDGTPETTAETQTPAEGETKTVIVEEPQEISGFRMEDGYTPPTKAGYLFGGWYEDAECKQPIGDTVISGKYYAKFVPAEVLGVKAQVSANLMPPAQIGADTEGAIRFVTSVDSLDYQQVGFRITANGITFTSENNGKVYGELFYIDTNGTGVTKDPQSVKPQELFGGAAQFFKTQTFTKIPSSQFDMEMTVVPFWKTLDGTIVEGASAIKTVNDGIKAGNYYVVNSYEELTKILEYIDSNNFTDERTIKVAKSFEVSKTVNILANRKIVLQNDEDEKEPVTLYRGSGLAATYMFNISSGGTLTIRGVGESGTFVLDGKTQAGGEVEATQNLIVDRGTLTIENVTVQNAKKKSNSGGVIDACKGSGAGGLLTIKNSTFKNNYAQVAGGVLYTDQPAEIIDSNFSSNSCNGYYDKTNNIYYSGGAIYSKGANLHITGCTFQENKSITQMGGAIYNTGLGMNIADSKFISNQAATHGGAVYSTTEVPISDSVFSGNQGNQGGAVYMEGKGASYNTVQNTKFENNVASNAGGAIRSAGAAMTILDCTFEGNQGNNVGGGAIYTNAFLNLYGTDVGKAIFNKNVAKTGSAVFVSGSAKLRGTGYIFGIEDNQHVNTAGNNEYKEYTASNMTELNNAITAINDAGKVNYNVCIKVTDSFEVTSNIALPRAKNNATVLYNGGGTPEEPVTLYRGEQCKIMFTTYGNGALAIRGVGDTGSFVLDGRTENAAKNNQTSDFAESSGSLISNNGKLTLDHVKIQYAHKQTGGGAAISFGAYANVTATIRDSVFANNKTVLGGAIYISGKDSKGNKLAGVKTDITNTIFTDNEASSNGGAIYNTYAELSIANSSFTGNGAAQGGAVYHQGSATYENCTIMNTKFMRNTATNAGGALRNDKGTMIVTDCQFESNTAANAGGGAIYNNLFLTLQGTDVTKAFFNNNQATGASGKGGAVYNGGTLRGSGYLFENNTPAIGTPIGVESAENAVNLYRQ